MRKITHRSSAILFLPLAMSAFAARAQEVQNPMPPLKPLSGLEWRLPKKFATLDGDRLVVDIPAEAGPSDACATARLPAAMLSGAGGFAMAVEAEGRGISKPAKRHLGLKFQLHWRDGATGREGYPNCPNETGDFARKTLPDAFSYLSPLKMDNVIYQVHFYDPHDFTHQGVGGRPIGPKWPDPEKNWTRDQLREILRPVRAFEARHHAKIYVGEFSAAAGAEGAETYLRDCMALFNEYGWDWTYHAFREWDWWSVEHEGPDPKHMAPATDDTPRKRALLEGFLE